MAFEDETSGSDGAQTANSARSTRSTSREKARGSRTDISAIDVQTRTGTMHSTEPGLARQSTRRSSASKHRQPKWWKIRLFRGMINDVKRRAPYFGSDWKDAWDYRVVPATIYMYFANILPALAFSFDMFSSTNMAYGVNEVLFASVLGAVVFSLAAAQPLVIVGVTGPITVFNYTVFDIVAPSGIDYFGFMCWIGIWSMIMHWVLAITNSCNSLTYVTRFSCDIFGFYVAFIYLQKGIQVLVLQWEETDGESAFLAVTLSLLVLIFAYGCGHLGASTLFRRSVRIFIEDYGTPLTIIFFTGFVFYGPMADADVQRLPVSEAFHPTTKRSWLIDFWNLPVRDIFLAFPFAMLLTVLFWFDHNVSSLIAQGSEYPLRKPPGFHWDIFLLGVTTGIGGILGLPFPNGLIPQAPFHTTSLCVTKHVSKEEAEAKSTATRIVDHVVEQRFSNLAQGLLTLVTMTGPLLTVLGLVPQGVLAGLFFVMGVQALEANGMTQKILYLLRDNEHVPASEPLARLERPSAVWVFVAIELLGFGATFAITQTIAAIGFPIFIFILIPIRTFLMPKWFRPEELKALDAPTAGPFVMESVGGAYGEDDTDSDAEKGNQEDGRDPEHGPDVTGGRAIDSSDVAVADSLERGEVTGLTPTLHGRASLRRRSTATQQ